MALAGASAGSGWWRRRNRGMILLRGGLLASFVLGGLLGGILLISGCATRPVPAKAGPDGVQTVKVQVRQGYFPAQIEAKAGQPLRMEFYRDEAPSAESCAQELVIPAENVTLPLPNHEREIVEIKPQPAGEMEFHCGMNMMKGKIVFH